MKRNSMVMTRRPASRRALPSPRGSDGHWGGFSAVVPRLAAVLDIPSTVGGPRYPDGDRARRMLGWACRPMWARVLAASALPVGAADLRSPPRMGHLGYRGVCSRKVFLMFITCHFSHTSNPRF